MSKLSKLFGKSEKIKLGEKENEIELEIKPLTVENIDIFMDMGDESKRAEATKRLVKLTIQNAVPEATEDELKKISLQYTMELLDKILKVNNLDKETSDKTDLIKNVQERIRQKTKK